LKKNPNLIVEDLKKYLEEENDELISETEVV